MTIEKGKWYLCNKRIGRYFTVGNWYYSPRDNYLNADNGREEHVPKTIQCHFTGGEDFKITVPMDKKDDLQILIQKREIIFSLMGEYGGTATLDYVRHDIVRRIHELNTGTQDITGEQIIKEINARYKARQRGGDLMTIK